MSVRSIVIGLGLVLGLCICTYYNDWIIIQRGLTDGLLPVGVFGVVLVGVLLINPLLGLVREGWMLRPGELVVIVVMGLAAASFPGGAFSRLFSPMMVLPAHSLDVNPSWQAAHVRSYVPGGSAELGEGHVTDFAALGRQLVEAPDESFLGHVRLLMSPEAQHALAEVAQTSAATSRRRQEIVAGLNEVIRGSRLSERALQSGLQPEPLLRQMLKQRDALDEAGHARLNRLLLQSALPGLIRPMPRGDGVLLLGGRADPQVVDAAIVGIRSHERAGPLDLPWAAWWPTIRLWGGLFVTLTLASLCLVLIVHPQWSKRELLPYPVVQVADLLLRREPGRLLPAVAQSRMFWYGFVAIGLVSAINGAHDWFPGMPVYLPMRYDLSPLMELFPNAARVEGSWGVFRPFIFPTAIAFSFFLSSRVALSLGVSMILWIALGGVMIENGVAMNSGEAASRANLLLFGGGVGLALAVLYAGRRHYWDVLRSALGARRSGQTPAYCVWAARLLAVCVGASVWLLYNAGLDPILATLFVILLLLIFLAITRVNAESGAFLLFVGWIPATILLALLGPTAIGPTAYIVLLLGSAIYVMDTSNPAMAQMANAMYLADRSAAGLTKQPPHRTAGLMTAVVLVGLPVAIVVVLLLHYNLGMNLTVGWWVRDEVSQLPFTQAAQMIADLSARRQLQAAVGAHGLDRLSLLDPQSGALMWVGVGIALVLLCMTAHLRLPWWPLHPVLFVFWGTFPSIMLSVSFLIGWAIKASVVNVGGARAYHAAKPLMVGVIAGELVVGLAWLAVGAVYHFTTGFPSPMGKPW